MSTLNGPSWAPSQLKTSRLLLRGLKLSDATDLFEYAKNPNVPRWTLWDAHKSIDDSESFIRDYAWENYSQGVPEPWGIFFQGKLIGTVGCFWSSRENSVMELAYALGEDHWGQGFVVEASQVVLNWVFQEMNPHRIQARCKFPNKASARVLEKLGMTYEGTLRGEIFHRGEHWDMHYYSLMHSEWKESPYETT